MTEQLLAKLFSMGIINTKKSLAKTETASVSAFCRWVYRRRSVDTVLILSVAAREFFEEWMAEVELARLLCAYPVSSEVSIYRVVSFPNQETDASREP